MKESGIKLAKKERQKELYLHSKGSFAAVPYLHRALLPGDRDTSSLSHFHLRFPSCSPPYQLAISEPIATATSIAQHYRTPSQSQKSPIIVTKEPYYTKRRQRSGAGAHAVSHALEKTPAAHGVPKEGPTR